MINNIKEKVNLEKNKMSNIQIKLKKVFLQNISDMEIKWHCRQIFINYVI